MGDAFSVPFILSCLDLVVAYDLTRGGHRNPGTSTFYMNDNLVAFNYVMRSSMLLLRFVLCSK